MEAETEVTGAVDVGSGADAEAEASSVASSGLAIRSPPRA